MKVEVDRHQYWWLKVIGSQMQSQIQMVLHGDKSVPNVLYIGSSSLFKSMPLNAISSDQQFNPNNFMSAFKNALDIVSVPPRP